MQIGAQRGVGLFWQWLEVQPFTLLALWQGNVKKSPATIAYEAADAHWREIAEATYAKHVSWWALGPKGWGTPDSELRRAFLARLEAWDAWQEEKVNLEPQRKTG